MVNVKHFASMNILHFSWLALAPALLLFACGREELPLEEPAIKFNLTVADLDPASRSVKTGWESGDVLYLWFAPVTQAQPDLTLTFDGKDWKAGSLRKGCELSAKGTFQVLYSGPDGLMATGSSSRSAFLFQNPKESVTQDGKGSGDVYDSSLQAFCQNVGYQFADDVLTAAIDGWKLLTDFQITLTDIPKGEYALLCTTKGNYVTVQEGFLLDSSSLSASGQDASHYAHGESTHGEAVFYYARTNGTDASSVISLTLIPKKSGAYLYSNALTYSPGEKKLKPAGTLQAVTVPYSKFIKTPEAVDMGLSVKWSTFNLGAAFEGEYGYHYCYGELEPKEEHYWDNYRFSAGQYNEMTKYCPKDQEKFWAGSGEPDGKTVLDLEDDVANVKLGGKWRIPTENEWRELIANCEWAYGQKNGLNGFTVTSKKTGKSIFLPLAGHSFSSTQSGFGSAGYYQSSTLYTEMPSNNWVMYCNSSVPTMTYDYIYRCYGFSVRPVFGD